jgi:hypothetical protein
MEEVNTNRFCLSSTHEIPDGFALPSLIVGNELLILGGFSAAVGVWFVAHRHGQLRGLVDAGKPEIEAVAGKIQNP